MKRLVCMLLILPSFAVVSCGGKATSVTLASGEVTYTPPPGWTEQAVPGGNMTAVIGPAKGGFAANINIVREGYSGSLDSYATANVKTLVKMIPSFKEVSRGGFTTGGGLEGVKLESDTTQQNIQLRQTFYFFGKGSTKYTVTCSCLRGDAGGLGPVFDAAMKTFAIKK